MNRYIAMLTASALSFSAHAAVVPLVITEYADGSKNLYARYSIQLGESGRIRFRWDYRGPENYLLQSVSGSTTYSYYDYDPAFPPYSDVSPFDPTVYTKVGKSQVTWVYDAGEKRYRTELAPWGWGIVFNDAAATFSIEVDWSADNAPTRAWLITGSDVPEPSAWAMMVGGFGLIGVIRRRRRSDILSKSHLTAS